MARKPQARGKRGIKAHPTKLSSHRIKTETLAWSSIGHGDQRSAAAAQSLVRSSTSRCHWEARPDSLRGGRVCGGVTDWLPEGVNEWLRDQAALSAVRSQMHR